MLNRHVFNIILHFYGNQCQILFVNWLWKIAKSPLCVRKYIENKNSGGNRRHITLLWTNLCYFWLKVVVEAYFKMPLHCHTLLFCLQVPEDVRTRNNQKKLELEAELEQNHDALMKLEALETD